jgi:hypothetical protein
MSPRDSLDYDAWVQTHFTPAEWSRLQTRMAFHEQRLQTLTPEARTDAVIDALLADAQTDPTLAQMLRQIGQHGAQQRASRAQDN